MRKGLISAIFEHHVNRTGNRHQGEPPRGAKTPRKNRLGVRGHTREANSSSRNKNKTRTCRNETATSPILLEFHQREETRNRVLLCMQSCGKVTGVSFVFLANPSLNPFLGVVPDKKVIPELLDCKNPIAA